MKKGGGIAAANDGGNAQLTGDDGGMGEGGADIGDHGGGTGKSRVQAMSVWAATENLPRLEKVPTFRTFDDAHNAFHHAG